MLKPGGYEFDYKFDDEKKLDINSPEFKQASNFLKNIFEKQVQASKKAGSGDIIYTSLYSITNQEQKELENLDINTLFQMHKLVYEKAIQLAKNIDGKKGTHHETSIKAYHFQFAQRFEQNNNTQKFVQSEVEDEKPQKNNLMGKILKSSREKYLEQSKNIQILGLVNNILSLMAEINNLHIEISNSISTEKIR